MEGESPCAIPVSGDVNGWKLALRRWKQAKGALFLAPVHVGRQQKLPLPTFLGLAPITPSPLLYRVMKLHKQNWEIYLNWRYLVMK
jgi:hypothetical protein